MQKKPTALITGIAGQDGSYLAEFLLSKGYRVIGVDLPANNSASIGSNIAGFAEKLELHSGDILDEGFINGILKETQPDEIYHLAAASFVHYSSSAEKETLSKNISGTHNLLTAFKETVPTAKFFFAGTSEMFGQPPHMPQNTLTPLMPRSVYGVSKVCGYHLVNYYRNQFNLFAVTGILFNHESPRRGPNFVTQKIARAAVAIKAGLQTELLLGNLDARRDWGHARDYVRGFWLQLQHHEKRDFIFASGTTHTVREFVERAFSYVGLNFERYVKVSEELYRPSEHIDLVGDTCDTERLLGWKPQCSFDELVAEMMDHQLKLLSNPRQHAHGK